ncbi:MAG: LD-carboxypeptidase [Vicinamibacteria bacterium]|nr:LD-carboxypeptidase [Vicinamibacteria bacterium]
MNDRRDFLARTGAAALAALSSTASSASAQPKGAPVKPPRLKAGDTLGLIHPSSATFQRMDLEIAIDNLKALGFNVKAGAHALDRYGYLAGKDEDRASDINALFADKSVQGICAVRGGWGAARLLPYLNFDVIAKNPKVLFGFSDITALHMAIPAKTGLVTFHAPTGFSAWTELSANWFKRVVMEGEPAAYVNEPDFKNRIVPVGFRTQTLTPGRAQGPLVGGNLTVLAHLVGTPYLPDFTGRILFLEDVHEGIYRIDRMLTHLKLAGLLAKIRGFIWGQCSDCEPDSSGYGSLTIEEVLEDHIKPLGVPAYRGAMIGHIDKQFTVPEGIPAEMDAEAGTFRLLESAVA